MFRIFSCFLELVVDDMKQSVAIACRRRLFPFRKRSLPFLTVDAIIGNQACSIADVIVCSGMCYDKAISNFFKSS